MTLELSDEKINTQGGLSLVGKLLSRFCRFGDYFKEPAGSRTDRIGDADVLTAEVGLLVQGRTHYDDIELFRQDASEDFSEASGFEKIPVSRLRYATFSCCGIRVT